MERLPAEGRIGLGTDNQFGGGQTVMPSLDDKGNPLCIKKGSRHQGLVSIFYQEQLAFGFVAGLFCLSGMLSFADRIMRDSRPPRRS
jgi:hypothetical protein